MNPFAAVVDKDNVDAEVRADVVVMLLLLETDKLPKVTGPDAVRLKAPELVTDAVPVVPMLKLGVAMFMLTMFPDVEVIRMLEVAFTVPAD